MDYPDHVTILKGIHNRYCAAIMKWDALQERYTATYESPYGSRERAEKEADRLADDKRLERL